ncbi:MAG: BMP family ABC transporter substrate-binding protein [Bacilli bacterium]|nr:BMP family ABC transporter substrate-binding protein [Bacilli bacterium]
MKNTKHLLLASLMTTALLTSCSGTEATFAPVAKENVKVGLICLHDDSSTYDKNFIDGMNRAFDNLGLEKSQLKLATGIGEDSTCYDKAVEFANDGCQVIFADSFGHEDYLMSAAAEYPSVQFAHATGTKAHTATNLHNYSNAFASIYEGRYLAGVAAGMKLKELKEAGKLKGSAPKMGYVGAFSYAEVISGYTAFYLGAKSIVSDVTMEVKFTATWYDPVLEAAAANALIANGADLISQHADSMGAPEACETAKIPNVSYNGSTETSCPNTYITSSLIDWTPYFEYMIGCAIEGKKIDTDWTGTISTGSVKLASLGANAAEGTQAAIDAAKAKLEDGSLHVFDTNTFTVNGSKLTTYLADVDFDKDFTADREVIVDGYFHESEYRSAPYFDVRIDGITIAE